MSHILYIYIKYIRPQSAQVQYSRSCPIICSLHYNSSPNTSIVRLTATKFKYLKFSGCTPYITLRRTTTENAVFFNCRVYCGDEPTRTRSFYPRLPSRCHVKVTNKPLRLLVATETRSKPRCIETNMRRISFCGVPTGTVTWSSVWTTPRHFTGHVKSQHSTWMGPR
jgi:hypothetical protein